MLFKILCCVVVITSLCACDDSDEDYVDAVIDLLLNGASREFSQSDELDVGEEPVLSGGIWKCGNCMNINESKLIYTEVNEVDAYMMTDTSVDTQVGVSILNDLIAFTLPGMQCITIQSDTARVVRRVAGTCTSGAITLSVAPAARFSVHVYN